MALTAENGWVFSDLELKNGYRKRFTDFTVKPLPPPMPHYFATARKGEEGPGHLPEARCSDIH